LLDHASSKTDVIITFLAVLELVKQRSVSVAQEEAYGEVTIENLIIQPDQITPSP
jgi:segregation and condensation protein A